jgi:hypothetical protein
VDLDPQGKYKPRLQCVGYYMHCRSLYLPSRLSGSRHPLTAGAVRTVSFTLCGSIDDFMKGVFVVGSDGVEETKQLTTQYRFYRRYQI